MSTSVLKFIASDFSSSISYNSGDLTQANINSELQYKYNTNLIINSAYNRPRESKGFGLIVNCREETTSVQKWKQLHHVAVQFI